jgi:hypothetical protein
MLGRGGDWTTKQTAVLRLADKQPLAEIAAGGQVSERLLQQAKKIKKEDPEAHEKKISLQ